VNQVIHEVDVLLVEDVATDAELCIRTLKKYNISDRITWVKDGAEALDYFFDGLPDAITQLGRYWLVTNRSPSEKSG
jgi:CheY-like chemotaxis protein